VLDNCYETLCRIFVVREDNIEVHRDKERAMANDTRRSHHDRKGVGQPDSSESLKTGPSLDGSFSFRIKNEPKEYDDNEPKESRPSTSRTREHSSSDRRESKRSPSRTRSYKSSELIDPRSHRSSVSSDHSPRDYHGNEQRRLRPSKAMRIDTCDVRLSANIAAKARRRNSCSDSSNEEYPISYTSTDYTSTEHTIPLGYRSSSTKSYISTNRDRSDPKSHRSTDTSDTRENYGSELKSSRHSAIKAKRRNSCDYEHKSLRPSAGSAVKARRRNSFNDSFNEEFSITYMSSDHKSIDTSAHKSSDTREYYDNELKISTHSSAKAKRRNSCDYEHKSSKPSAESAGKSRRRNSFNDSYTEGLNYMSSDNRES